MNLNVLAPRLSAEMRMFDAWERRERALEFALSCRPEQLMVALQEWKAATSELTDAVVADTLSGRS